MLKISQERLTKIKNNFSGKNIMIVGDMMLDGYYWGKVKRISPEAPVPIVELNNEFLRFGGAANVALNILKLNGNPLPIGVVGNDPGAEDFKKLFKDLGISQDGIITDPDRPTTIKTRVIADQQHVVRIDRESKKYINSDIEETIFNKVKEHIEETDAIILQDYNKGVLTKSLIRNVINLANQHNKIITVDPKFNNFLEFENVTVFKPNKNEAENIFGIRIDSDKDIELAGKRLLNNLKSKYILLTLGKRGIALFENDKEVKRIPTKARKVSDVSGAGDTVISTLTMALAAGTDIYEAAYFANYAGGLVCEEVGIVPIDIDKLFNTLNNKIV